MMKRIFTILAAASVSLAATVSCSDLNRIQEDLDALENRVVVLEKILPALNDNIAAIKTLAEAVTLNKVEEKDGVYTITLSNGEQLTLTQGSIGVGKTPIMSVDKDGYWMVDYQDGTGAVPVLSEGQKVKATGKDGVTPKFSTDSEGYWTVSYDGKTYVQVKDVDGQPVKALADGVAADPFFKDVKLEGNEFTVTMQNGEVLHLPVVADFLCAIQGAETPQEFTAGESKAYTVTMKGVVSTVVTAPLGWTAVLTADQLTVTAPGTPAVTKAVIADSRTDVSILAISGSGLSVVAKIAVSLSGGSTPVDPDAPQAGDYVEITKAADFTTGEYIFYAENSEYPGSGALHNAKVNSTIKQLRTVTIVAGIPNVIKSTEITAELQKEIIWKYDAESKELSSVTADGTTHYLSYRYSGTGSGATSVMVDPVKSETAEHNQWIPADDEKFGLKIVSGNKVKDERALCRATGGKDPSITVAAGAYKVTAQYLPVRVFKKK